MIAAKKLIGSLAKRLGYRVSKIGPGDEPDAYMEMRRLFSNVRIPVIFDVGAHHGECVARFVRHFPSARIFAFEPFPESFEVLRGSTQADTNVRLFDFGLAEQSGPRSFHSNQSSATNSLLSSDEQSKATWGSGLLETKEVVNARFRTVDEMMAELALDHMDILKLDVQGAEPLVMKGARRTCLEGRIRAVYCEIITKPTYHGQSRIDEVLALFHNLGFDLHNLYSLNHSDDGRLRQLDALFTVRTPGQSLLDA